MIPRQSKCKCALPLTLLSVLFVLLANSKGSHGFAPTRTVIRTSVNHNAPTDNLQKLDFVGWGHWRPANVVLLSDNANTNGQAHTVRDYMREVTGLSLSAIRATVRTATGISLSAIYASTQAATGPWIRTTMKLILSVFPPWFRYFLQPFLILYYVPLFMLRNLTGPTRKRAMSTHEHFVHEIQEAVETADQTSEYWPVHLKEDGTLVKDFDEVDLREAIRESVEVALDNGERK